MQRPGIIPRLWEFVRSYSVAIALIVAFTQAFIEVYSQGTLPATQMPPEGYTVKRLNTTLQWNKGTRDEPITLQISMDTPDFSNPILERKIQGNTHTARNLEPGHTYYWRLVQDSGASSVASFVTSIYAVKY